MLAILCPLAITKGVRAEAAKAEAIACLLCLIFTYNISININLKLELCKTKIQNIFLIIINVTFLCHLL